MDLKLTAIAELLKELSEQELTAVIEMAKSKLPSEFSSDPLKHIEDFKLLILSKKATALGDRPHCPHCGSHGIVKNGTKDHRQRFKCKECGHTFTWTNNTILYGIKSDYNTLLAYCDCMMQKMSIRQCAEHCGISIPTSFEWRHKILDALQNMQNEVILNGTVESDETYFPLSFKGSRGLLRPAHQRGCSNHTRGISNELVCTSCSVNLNGLSIGKVTNLGRPCIEDLTNLINGRIEEGSFLVTDSLSAYDTVAEVNNLTHIKIEPGKHKNGVFDIQTVNSYHSELKRLINGRFKGVATKYLNNYVVYHNFVNFAKESVSDKIQILKDFVFSTFCNSRGYQVKFRNAVPV